jgi:putative FmdB family regulatory protein
MPIYEYRCSTCEQDFELLVRGAGAVFCPHCRGEEVKRKFSVFGMAGRGFDRMADSSAKPEKTGGGGCCSPSGCGCR